MTTIFSEMLLSDLRAESVSSLLVQITIDSGIQYPASKNAILHIVLRGKAFLVSQRAPPVPVSAGDSIFLLYGDSHSLVASIGKPAVDAVFDEPHRIREEITTVRTGEEEETALILSCAIDLAYLSPLARTNRAAADFCILKPDKSSRRDSALVFDLRQIEDCCVSPGATAFSTMLANFYLVHMLRTMRRSVWGDRLVEVRSPNIRRISAAVRKIHASPNRSWTVAGIAREVGMSRSSFARLFHEYMGIGPFSYITSHRMKDAAYLLSISDASLREVALRVGYDLEDSFSRAFKQYYGASPSEYRKLNTKHQKPDQ